VIRPPRAPHVRRSTFVLVLAVAALAFPLGVLANHQFVDVPSDASYHDDVEALLDAGITSGCTSQKYCPNQAVTRGQMAQFLNRLGDLSGAFEPSVNADKVDGLDSTAFMRGYQIVSETESADPDKSVHAVACPEGKVPMGGGWHDLFFDAGSVLNAGITGPLSSFPTESGWSFTYWNNLPQAHDVVFYVICAQG
jgi:hypothetical protein